MLVIGTSRFLLRKVAVTVMVIVMGLEFVSVTVAVVRAMTVVGLCGFPSGEISKMYGGYVAYRPLTWK